jgi:hypothetical protein
MRTLTSLVLSAGLLGFAGCGGGSGPATLTCAWLAGDNCWKQTVASAAACLPATSDTGTFSADNSTCTYASGQVITFTPPLPTPIDGSGDFDVTITNGGQQCLHYKDNPTGFTLTVMGQTVTEGGSGGGFGLQITCPDGTSVSNPNALSLLDCGADAGATFGGLPGKATGWTDTSLSFSLIGASGTAASAQVFSCSK